MYDTRTQKDSKLGHKDLFLLVHKVTQSCLTYFMPSPVLKWASMTSVFEEIDWQPQFIITWQFFDFNVPRTAKQRWTWVQPKRWPWPRSLTSRRSWNRNSFWWSQEKLGKRFFFQKVDCRRPQIDPRGSLIVFWCVELLMACEGYSFWSLIFFKGAQVGGRTWDLFYSRLFSDTIAAPLTTSVCGGG